MTKNMRREDAAQRVKAEHIELLNYLRRVREAWPTYDGLMEARRSPAEHTFPSHCLSLRERFSRHFAAEEEGGHLTEALGLAPEFLSHAKLLLLEHRDLIRRLDRLLVDVQSQETSPDSWADTTQDFGRLILRLHRHEEAENELLTSATR